MGWIRLARKHRLTIVPMCITGSHRTLPILARGKALSWILGTRWIGVHRAPLPVLTAVTAPAVLALARAAGASWPASVALSWASAWLTFMLPFVPAEIGFHLLQPIFLEEFEDQDDRAIYVRVVGSLQQTLDAYARGRSSRRRG
jgi:1-acyl-sn-glycerol-3-phosphate acyltransferase